MLRSRAARREPALSHEIPFPVHGGVCAQDSNEFLADKVSGHRPLYDLMWIADFANIVLHVIPVPAVLLNQSFLNPRYRDPNGFLVREGYLGQANIWLRGIGEEEGLADFTGSSRVNHGFVPIPNEIVVDVECFERHPCLIGNMASRQHQS